MTPLLIILALCLLEVLEHRHRLVSRNFFTNARGTNP
jgi:hypothetical protein